MPLMRRVFYGWYVVAAVLVITTAISGFFFYNLSILLAAFVAERGFPVGLASSATATFFLAAGIGGLAAGRLVDRFDVRFFVVGGTLLTGGVGSQIGTLAGVLIFGTIKTALDFDGRLSSWWLRIAIGGLLLLFILLQRTLSLLKKAA